MSLESRLEQLNTELSETNTSLESLVSSDLKEGDDVAIEALVEQINNLTKEMASIIGAME